MRRPDLVAVAILALAATLRFSTIDVQPYWFDERLTQGTLRLGFLEMLEALITTGRETNPPLYYVLAWPWSRVFGDDPLPLRSFSALAGTATVGVAYLAGRDLVSIRVGRVIACLATVSPLLVWYSQEARAYALVALFSSLSVLYFVRSLESPSALRRWALFSSLALLVHYFAIFLVAAESLCLLRRHRRRALSALAPVAATTIVLAPLALVQRSDGGTSWISTVPLIERLTGSANSFLTGASEGTEVAGSALLVIALTGLGLALGRAAHDERQGALIALTIGSLSLLLPFLVALVGVDLVNGRNLIVGWLPVALGVGTGFGTRRAKRVGLVAGCAFCLLSVAVIIAVAVSPDLQREASPYPARPEDPK